jgi:hypothetical protein
MGAAIPRHTTARTQSRMTTPRTHQCSIKGNNMRIIRNRRRDEAGMVTSEYAVGTVGSCGVAGALITLASTDWFQGFIKGFLNKVTDILPF